MSVRKINVAAIYKMNGSIERAERLQARNPLRDSRRGVGAR